MAYMANESFCSSDKLLESFRTLDYFEMILWGE